MTPENENVFETIGSAYYALTASEKKVADFILSNQSGTQFLSISELAEASDVAEATVSRFCRRLGYRNYNTFKLSLANSLVQHKPVEHGQSGEVREDDAPDVVMKKRYTAAVEAITQTMEFLNVRAVSAAADLLQRAKRVLCMGQGGSMLAAGEAAHLFSTVSNKFIPVSDSHIQTMAAASAEPDDVILYFSYSGSTAGMIPILKLARRRRAKIILVTRFPNSPGAAQADTVLQCGSNQDLIQGGSAAARIAQLYLLDVLFSEFSRRDPVHSREARSRIADALAEKHL